MSALVLLLVLPLAAALATLLAPRAAPALTLGSAAAGVGAALRLAQTVAQDGVQAIALAGWAPPLGITVAADGLAAAFVLMTALVMLAVALAAKVDLAPGRAGARVAFGFWPIALLLWGALNAVFLSRDLFNLYVGIELLTLAAVALVALSGKPGALVAAMRYMIFALAGSLLYLLGVVLVYGGHGTLDVGLLAARTPAATDALALALMSAGLAAKTALFPFHVWLPPAHAGAPAPASAMLSGLVPKASFVILIRLGFEAMPDQAGAGALLLLGLMGAAAVIWGSLRALSQPRLKLIVAYSTVAQLGYLFLVFPLAGGDGAAQPWAAGAWTGAMFQALSHGLAKAAMFLCAGLWVMAAGGDRLTDLRGLARPMPMTAMAFGLAAVTLMGLPPSGGFTAKYLMMTAAFASGQWGWALVLAGGGLLAAGYLYRPMAEVFARDCPVTPQPVARAWQAVPLALALAAIVLGLISAPPFDLLQVGRPAAAEVGL
ncbi:MAG: hypothetical protein JJU40_15935 [Rhodobacteraceae bacterium]|nr:hypothetical protein [Paracoccaceae bacterium]